MDSFLWSHLVLLLIVVFVAGYAGFILGSICATGARADRVDPFMPREFEHECDARCYPRIGD
jgi:hypothetical protein